MGSRHAVKERPAAIKLEQEDFIIASDDHEKATLPDPLSEFDPDNVATTSGHEIPLPNIFSSPFKNAPPPPSADSFHSPSKALSTPDEYPLPGTNSPVKHEPLLSVPPEDPKSGPPSPPITMAMPTLTPSPGKKAAGSQNSLRFKAHMQASQGSGNGGKLRCVCEFVHNDGFIVQCNKCRLWQHIDCFYPNASTRPVVHRCHVCVPRFVDVSNAKRLQTKKMATRSLESSESDSLVHERSDSCHMPNVQPAPTISRHLTQPPVVSRHSGVMHTNTAISRFIDRSHSSMEHMTSSLASSLSGVRTSSLPGFLPSCSAVPQPQPARSSKRKQSLQLRSTPDPMLQQTEDEIKQSMMVRVASRSRRYKHAERNRYTEDLYRILFRNNKSGVPIKHSLIAELSKKFCETMITPEETIALSSPSVYSLYDTVLEYRGELMTKEEYLENHDPIAEYNPYALFYSGVSGVTIVVDATKYGNEARFVRRSCKPNCEVKHTFGENSRLHLIIWATQKIPAGKEVTIPFDFDYAQVSYEVFCPCGKKTCDVRRWNTQPPRPPHKKEPMKEEDSVATKRLKLTAMKSEKSEKGVIKPEPRVKSEITDDFAIRDETPAPSITQVSSTTNSECSSPVSLPGSPLKACPLPLNVSRLRSDAEARASLTARLQVRLSPSKGPPLNGKAAGSNGSPMRGPLSLASRSPLKPASPGFAYNSPANRPNIVARRRSRKQQLVVTRNPFSEDRNASSEDEDAQGLSFWKK